MGIRKRKENRRGKNEKCKPGTGPRDSRIPGAWEWIMGKGGW